MEKDDEMRRVMELLLSDILRPSGFKTATPDLFVSRCCQTKEFFRTLTTVLAAKRTLIYKKWEEFCAISCFNALSTHEMYFRYVVFACEIEVGFYDNIFDKIISVLALVINFNIETLINSNVNFCEFSVDIFMVFYNSTLKESFNKKGGFKQFSEYLLNHEYLPWKNFMCNDLNGSNVTEELSFLKNLQCKNEKNIEMVSYHPNFIKHSDVIENTKSESLAKEILSTTKIKLPELANSADLKVRLEAAWKMKASMHGAISKLPTMGIASEGQRMTKFAKYEMATESSKLETLTASSNRETVETVSEDQTTTESPKRETTVESPKCKTLTTSSNLETANTVSIRKAPESYWRSITEAASNRETTETVLKRFENLECDSQMNNAVEQKLHLDWCEDIVRKVIKYNNSKCSDPVDENNEIQREADKFLKQLNDMIKSLIDIL